jgi:glycosyltransferase involved in cell wall biosynthesis
MRVPIHTTVIIPVHNGAAALRATLEAFLGQEIRSGVRIVVVCNGCADNSLAAALSCTERLTTAGYEFAVLKLEEASKIKALNAGETLACGNLIYLDHDALLSPGAMRALTEAFSSGWDFVTLQPVLQSPTPLMAKLYFKAWRECEYVQNSPATIGMYAVSERGRMRWGTFPEIHSDDKFVRLHFLPEERVSLKPHTYAVLPWATFKDMVRARRRYNKGNKQLASSFPQLIKCDLPRYEGVRSLLLRPGLWPSLLALGAVYLASLCSKDQ